MIFRREARNNSNNISCGGARFFALRFFTFLLQDCVVIFLDFCGDGVL